MRLNNIGYLLKEGIKGIFSHGFMSFAAVCVTVACLVIVGSFSILAYNLDVMVEDLNQTSEILVYVDADLPDAQARSIGTQINLMDNVLKSTFVSREEALEDFHSEGRKRGRVLLPDGPRGRLCARRNGASRVDFRDDRDSRGRGWREGDRRMHAGREDRRG